MILRVGQHGIVKIVNTKTKSQREMIVLYKGMVIDGIVGLMATPTEDVAAIIELGYNEHIYFDTRNDALKLMKLINTILVKGGDVENTLKNMVADATDRVFHKNTNDVGFECEADDPMSRLKSI